MMKLNTSLSEIEGLDRLLAMIGVIAGIILSIIILSISKGGAYRYLPSTVFLSLFCILYLLLRKRIDKAGADKSPSMRSGTYTLINILFFMIYVVGIGSVILRPEIYARPLEFFIAVSLLNALLAFEILAFPQGGRYTYFTLVKIFLVSFTVSWTPHVIYPILGFDPNAHSMFIKDIIDTGHIPADFSYTNLPVMHLIATATSLLTGLDYEASKLSLYIFHAVGLLFIYLIGKRICDERVGLLSALLLGNESYWIHQAYSNVPITLATIMLPVIIYLLFKPREENRFNLIFLTIVLSASLILLHTIGALSLGILLFLFWVSLMIYDRKNELSKNITLNYAVLFTVLMFAWWAYASGHFKTLASVIRWGFVIDEWGTKSSVGVNYLDNFKLEYILDNLGLNLYYAFAIIGSLALLSKKRLSAPGFALVASGIFFVIFIFGLILSNLSGAIPCRWYPISRLLIAVPAVVGILSLGSLVDDGKRRFFSSGIFLVFTFLLITNSISNFDNPIYTKNIAIRESYISSEMESANTVSGMNGGVINTDRYYSHYFIERRDTKTRLIKENLVSGNFSDLKGMIVLRKEIANGTFSVGGAYRLDYDVRERLDDSNIVYESGSVTAFLPK